MKYVLSGGGTAGHVMPAIAIGEGLKRLDKKAELLYIGRSGGNENQSIVSRGLRLETLEVYGFNLNLRPSSLKRLYTTLKSIGKAKALLSALGIPFVKR